MYDHILIGLEGLAADRVAVEHGIALAKHESAAITLLRVITPAIDTEDGMKHLLMEEGSKGWYRKKEAEAALQALVQHARSSGVQADSRLIIGDREEADEIVDYAAKGAFSLIIMAAEDRSWWDRERTGSLADGVYRKATVPTLFVSSGSRRSHVAPLHQVEKDPLNGFTAEL